MLDLIMTDKRVEGLFQGYFAGTLDIASLLGEMLRHYPDVSAATFLELHDFYQERLGE